MRSKRYSQYVQVYVNLIVSFNSSSVEICIFKSLKLSPSKIFYLVESKNQCQSENTKDLSNRMLKANLMSSDSVRTMVEKYPLFKSLEKHVSSSVIATF